MAEQTKQNTDERQTGSLKERLARVSILRWLRFAFAMLIIIAFLIWTGWWWGIFFIPFIADMYLTQFIPWTWWKYTDNKLVKGIMGWVDPIVYACVLVYFLFDYVGQNYQIPSSSLEKSLLVGDYLWVNKMAYGPRVPITPVHFPLVHNTLPFFNCRSYTDTPSNSYRRLKGFRNIERNDIVVFNYPCGDTTFTRVQNPDYYTLCALHGKDFVMAQQAELGEMVWRPIDRRENYVKRCLGLPGEKLQIKNNVVFINGKPLEEPENVQYNYFVQTKGGEINDEQWERIGISVDDRNLLDINASVPAEQLTSFGLIVGDDGKVNPVYQVPLTYAAAKAFRQEPNIATVVKVPTYEEINVFPIQHDYGWNRSNLGEIWIPKKGESIALDANNYYVYERAIRTYEGNTLEIRNGQIFINGKQTNKYTFKMDYYWMMGDNRDNSLDSRYWGFVPEDHVVGTPFVILISFDKDKSMFNGGIRWSRMFKSAKV